MLTRTALGVYALTVVIRTISEHPLTSLYAWHRILATAFLCVLVLGTGEAQKRPGCCRSATATTRHSLLLRHMFWQIGAATCGFAAAAAIYLHKERIGRAHLSGWHGLLGAATLISLSPQSAAGHLILHFPGVAARFGLLRLCQRAHVWGGYAAVAGAMATHALALRGGWVAPRGTLEWYVLAVALASVGALVLAEAVRVRRPPTGSTAASAEAKAE